MRDEADLLAHVDYIHYNPVKHGLVTRVSDWPYSSFHRFVRMGWLSADWADDPNLSEGMTGEWISESRISLCSIRATIEKFTNLKYQLIPSGI